MQRIRMKVQYLVLCRPGSGSSAISVGTQMPTNVPHLLCIRRLATACMLTAVLSKLRLHRDGGGALHVRKMKENGIPFPLVDRKVLRL